MNFNKFLQISTNFNYFYKFLIISIISILHPFSVYASVLYFLPQAADIYRGDSFIVEAGIDTESKEINAIDGEINFSADSLQVVVIEKGGSSVDLWVNEPRFANTAGKIEFSGGMPGGFKGQGTLFKIIFQSKAGKQTPFSSEVKYNEKTQVLLNDGNGTMDALKLLTGNYAIKEKAKDLVSLASPSHPDQNIWYIDNNFALRWDLVKDAQYSYLLSQDPANDPDEVADKPKGDLVWMGAMSYKGLEDGIYYFFVKQKPLGGYWSPKTSFRVMIDTTPPLDFTPEITDIEGKKYLVFLAKDAASGIDYYQVQEKKETGMFGKILKNADEPSYEMAASPYLLKDQALQSAISVVAVDKAGNKKAAIIPPQKPAKDFENYLFWSIIILAIIIYLVRRFLWRKFFQGAKKHE